MSLFLPCISIHKLRFLGAWFLLWCLPVATLYGQYPSLVHDWDQDFGGNIWEDLHAMEQTADGGYILAGFSSSSMNGDITQPTRGQGDFWAVKTDAQGQMEWNQRYGGAGMELAWGVKQTADGGYIFGGWSESDIGGEKTEMGRGYYDYWLIKTDAFGVPEWDRTYGGDSTDLLYELIETADGGYMIGGISQSGASGERSDPRIGDFDWWVLKLDNNGNIQWERSYGGSEEDRLNGIRQDSDGNFVLAGGTRSGISGDISTPLRGVKDFWVIKVDQFNGDIIWQRRYGGTNEDEIQTFTITSDGGYLLAGGSRSDAYLPDKKDNARGIVDVWVVKTDAAGAIEWEHTFGGPGLENCYSIKENTIGHFLLGGYSGSDAGPDKTENSKGGLDYWIIYLDPNGNKLWDKTIGGAQDDVLENLFQTDDGGYLLGGHSQSDVSGDKTSANKGLNDYWVIKTTCNLSLDLPDYQSCPNNPIQLDAYDPNCIACEWFWSDGNRDSIRTVAPATTTTYSVTLTDGVGCARFDEITVTVSSPPPLELGQDQIICEGASMSLDAGNAESYIWSTGEITSEITIDTTGTYAVTITDTRGCTNSDSITISVQSMNSIDLGPDTSFCSGASVFLDAGPTGVNYNWSPGNGNNQFFEVNQAGMYSVEVTDNNNCRARDTIWVAEYDAPSIVTIDRVCNVSNTAYTVQFEIVGGDPASYQVTGDAGVLNANIFTSVPISKDQPYTFYLSDSRGCGPLEISGNYDCACSTMATQLENQPIELCGVTSFTVPIEAPADLDSNDVVQYILHNGTATMIGTVLDNRSTPSFDWIAGTMSFGVTYYVTAIAGNNNGSGLVDQQDGCLSESTGIPVIFYTPPEAMITFSGPSMIDCQINSILLDGSNSMPIGNLDFQWQVLGNGTILNGHQSPIAEVSEAGDYQLIVSERQSGCKDTTAIRVEASDDVPVAAIASPDQLTCIDTAVLLDASTSSSGPEFSYLWGGGTIDGNTANQVIVDQPGTYTLTVTNTTNSCSQTATATVEADTVPPLVDAGFTDELNCSITELSLDGSFTSDGDVSYVWSTTDGHIVINEQSLNPLVDAPGRYTLEVTNLRNGCVGSDDVVIRVSDDVPSSAIFEIVDPSCFDTDDGLINIITMIGGTAPYVYSLDGENYSTSASYTNLSAGDYHLWVEDANGCEWDTLIQLLQPPPFVVSLGVDQEIQLGDSIQLKPQSNLIPASFEWLTGELANCENCWWPWVRPASTTRYTIELINDTGCKQTAGIQIFVRKERNVFIPSAFSPNGDGINDSFTIFGDASIATIQVFRIFDRWGELMFELKDFAPNDERIGWDGRYNGELLNSGVFVYYAEIEFTDGIKEIYKGDITIAR